MTSTALARFEDLRRQFRAMVPSRKISRERWRDIARAASIQQVAEMAVIERACGAGHDRDLIERMKLEVHQNLAAAGVKIK